MSVSVCFYKWKPERINIKAHFANGMRSSIYRHSGGFDTVPCWILHGTVLQLTCARFVLSFVWAGHGTVVLGHDPVFSFWHVLNSFCLMCELATVPYKSLHGTVLVFWICLFLGLWARCRVFLGTVPCSFVLLVFSSVFLQLFACFFVWGLVSPEITYLSNK